MSLQRASKLVRSRATAVTKAADKGRSVGSRLRRRAMITLRRRRSTSHSPSGPSRRRSLLRCSALRKLALLSNPQLL